MSELTFFGELSINDFTVARAVFNNDSDEHNKKHITLHCNYESLDLSTAFYTEIAPTFTVA
jgi:hypothetical protein